MLAGTRHLILIGTQAPITFFAYPGKPHWLTPEGCALHTLVERQADIDGALDAGRFVAPGVSIPGFGSHSRTGVVLGVRPEDLTLADNGRIGVDTVAGAMPPAG